MSISITSQADRIKVATHGNGVYESPLALGVATKEISNPALQQFKVYPNPAVQSPSSASFSLTKPADFYISVVDIQGKLIYKSSKQLGHIGQVIFPFDISLFNRGVYTVVLQGMIRQDKSPFYQSKMWIKQ